MRILKRILLSIMVTCLCASAGISLAFAEGESSAEGYTGTRYTVTGGAAGGQPLWFGNATPVNYAEAGTEVNVEYTVKTNAMSGDGISGLCRIFKELGNCWFNTASVSYCGWNEGYNWQTLFEVGATYKIRFYNLTDAAYSFSIIKTVDGADTDITSALSTTATWMNYGGTGYFGIGILNFAGTFEFDNVAIYNQNGANLGITNKDNTISTVVATEIKPEQPGESESTEEPGGEIVLPDYKGNRYDVVMGTWGGQPVAFGNSKALTTAAMYLQYTVVSNSMAGGQLGLLRGNGATLWFNTVGTTYADYADGRSYADLFAVGATYTIKYYDFNADTYSFAIYKEVDGEVTDITNYLTTTPTFNANSSNLGVFGMGAVNAGGTIELTNFAIFDENMTDLGAAKYTEDVSTFTATVINPVTFDEVEYNGGAYTVTNNGFLSTLYFGNKTAVPTEAGTKVFLEYEVESASTGATQWGMVETSTPSAQFAFTGGAMKFANGKACRLLEAGASYKYEWSVTESGVTIKGLKTSADGTLTDIVAHLDAETGALVANAYYGLWFSEGNTGEFKLVNVKCYDGEGKDLGFISNQGSVSATKDGETEDVVFDDVEYKSVLTYDIILNADPIFFGNKTAVSTEAGTKVFIEYKVAAAGNALSAQYGFVATSDPTYLYPFTDGRGTLAYQNAATQFNMEGATYKFEFIVTESGVDVKALRVTADGVKTDLSKEFESFSSLVANGHYGLWQSAGAIWGSQLVDCKCYDGEGNDLGFATQQAQVSVKEHEYEIVYMAGDENVTERMEAKSFTYSKGLASLATCDLENGTHVEKWYTDSELTNEITSIASGRTEEITLYGKVVYNDYVIIFNGNGADGEMQNINAKYGSKVTLAANAFDYGNFRFVGWMLRADGTEAVYTDGAEVENLVKTQNGTITLYALWEMQIWNINYVMPEGAVNSDDNPATYNENSVFDLAEATLTNYVFKGWYKDEAYTEKIVTIDSGSMSGELTLYAKFVKYTLDIPAVDYNGFVRYGVEANFSSAYITNSEPMTLKAGEKFFMEYKVESSADGSNQWGIIATASHDATYPYTGGAGVMIYANSNSNIFIAGTTVRLYVEVLETGYIKFVLGYIDAEGFEHDITDRLTNIVADGYEGAESLTLDTIPANYHYGLWNAGNAVTTTLSNFVVYNEKGENLKPMVNKCAYGSATITEPAYNVTYMVNGKPLEGLSENWTKFTYSDGLSALPAYKEEGKHVAGWYLDEAFTQIVTRIEKGIAHDITLYCKLEVNKYNVKFEGNGADNSMVDQVIAYGEKAKLSKNTLTKKGYKFAGWATKADGEVVYADMAEVENLSKTHNANVKLYALWTMEVYTIAYEADGGENPNTATEYSVESPVTLKDATKEGYTFEGWYTSADFSEESKVTALDAQGNVTLYAKFTKKSSGGCSSGATASAGMAVLAIACAAVVLKKRK